MPPPDAPEASPTTTTTAAAPAATTTTSAPAAPPRTRAEPAAPKAPKTVPGVQVTFLGPKDAQNLSRGEVKVAGLNWKPDHKTRTTRRWRMVDAKGKPDEKAEAELAQLQGHTLGSLGLVKPDHAHADKPAFKVEEVRLPPLDN